MMLISVQTISMLVVYLKTLKENTKGLTLTREISQNLVTCNLFLLMAY